MQRYMQLVSLREARQSGTVGHGVLLPRARIVPSNPVPLFERSPQVLGTVPSIGALPVVIVKWFPLGACSYISNSVRL